MALGAAAGAALTYILLPMFFVIWLAFFAQEIPSFPPEGYSLKWFRAVPGNDRFVSGFLLSMQVAVVATSIGLAIGVPAAVRSASRPTTRDEVHPGTTVKIASLRESKISSADFYARFLPS